MHQLKMVVCTADNLLKLSRHELKMVVCTVDNLLMLSRHQLKMAVAIFTGHVPVRGHLYIMGLSDGDPPCRFCRMETETVQNNISCCEALSHQRYNIFGKLTAKPRDTSTTSVRELYLLI